MLRKKNLHVHLSKKHMYIVHVFFSEFPLYCLYISILRISKVVLRQIQSLFRDLTHWRREMREIRVKMTRRTQCASVTIFIVQFELNFAKIFFSCHKRNQDFFLRPVRSRTCRAQEPKNASVFHYNLMGLLYARTQQKRWKSLVEFQALCMKRRFLQSSIRIAQ